VNFRLAAALLCLLAAPAALGGEPPARLTVELLDYRNSRPTSGWVRALPATQAGDALVGGWQAVRGRVTLELAPGVYRLQIDGGRRRLPYDKEVELRRGSSERRTVLLRQPDHLDFERRGWVAADPFFSAGGLTPSAAALAAEASELAALGLDGPPLRDARPLRNGPLALSWAVRPDPRYGDRGLLRLPGPDAGVPPLAFYADCGRPRRFNPWTGIVPWRPELAGFYDLLSSRGEATRGLAPRLYHELVAGAPEPAFELDGSESSLRLGFALLQQGWRLPAVAGSRGRLGAGDRPEPRMLLRPTAAASGGRGGAAGAVLEALRAGRACVSFGPFCLLDADGTGPGGGLAADERVRRIEITAAASTDRRAELSRIELYRDGELLRRLDVPGGHTGYTAELMMRLDEPGWLVAVCWQRVRPADGGGSGAESCAVTNPVWIETAAYSLRPAPVHTRLTLRAVDAASGEAVAFTVTGSGTAQAIEGVEPAAGRAAGQGFAWRCPSGTGVLEVGAAEPLHISAPGYADQKVDPLESLGLPGFAARHAAMKPEEAEASLCRRGTFEMLRQALRAGEATVRLRRMAE
jgi:hypothetical protein